jgi:hypothetical protein
VDSVGVSVENFKLYFEVVEWRHLGL